jgi:hypothetical protein
MRDEMDGRLWVAHHDELSLSIDRGLARLRNGLARLAAWDGTTPQLFAILAAFVITSLGFASTTSA